MDAVTPGMRERRRARRATERLRRGEVRRRTATPAPLGLRAHGWSGPETPPAAPGARLLGAATGPVAIADRARVTTASRGGDAPLFVPPAVARGPLPAAASLPRPSHPRVPTPSAAPPPEAPREPHPVPQPVSQPEPQPEPAPTPTPPPSTAPTSTTPAPATAPDLLPSDGFAHTLGLSPAGRPAPSTDRRAPAGRHSRVERRREARAAGTRRGRLLLAAAAVVVVLGGTGAVIGTTLADRRAADRSTTAPQVDALAAGVATWLSANVPTQQRIVTTDATLARDLNAQGVPADAVTEGATPPVGAVVVDTGTTTADQPVAALGTGSSVVLLAVFGDADRGATVGQVVDRAAAAVRTDLAEERDTARSACEGLAANAAVRIAGVASPVFDAGRLDLRASTTLAAIAQDQRVQVVDAPQDDAERRAGRPVRTLVVKVDDAGAVREIAATAKAPYDAEVEAAPADDGVPAGSLLLRWPAAADGALTAR